MADGFSQIRHLDRGQRGFESLVPHLQSSAVNRLLERVAGKNAEGMRHAGFLCRLANAARDLVDDHIVVPRVSAKQAAEADDGVIFLCFGERARGDRDLERPGYANNVDVVLLCFRSQQSIAGTEQEPLRDESIEPRDGDGKALSSRIQGTFKRGHCRLRRRFDLKLGFLLRDSVPPWLFSFSR